MRTAMRSAPTRSAPRTRTTATRQPRARTALPLRTYGPALRGRATTRPAGGPSCPRPPYPGGTVRPVAARGGTPAGPDGAGSAEQPRGDLHERGGAGERQGDTRREVDEPRGPVVGGDLPADQGPQPRDGADHRPGS